MKTGNSSRSLTSSSVSSVSSSSVASSRGITGGISSNSISSSNNDGNPTTMTAGTSTGNFSSSSFPYSFGGVSSSSARVHYSQLRSTLRAIHLTRCIVRYRHYLLITAVTILAYWPSLWAELVFDDRPALIDNKDIRPNTPIYRLFLNDYWGLPVSEVCVTHTLCEMYERTRRCLVVQRSKRNPSQLERVRVKVSIRTTHKITVVTAMS